jgi:hypothetical protein
MNLASSLALAAAAVLGILSTGCSTMVPFTQELRTANNLTNDDVKNLQFYTSHKITMRREVESGGSQVTGNHKLVVVSGKTIEEVVVEEKTPGVAVTVGDRTISISFEPGTSITFAAAAEPGSFSTDSAPPPPPPTPTFAEPPDAFPGNSGGAPKSPSPEPFPSLRGGSGSYWISVNPDGLVPFQGRSFTAVSDSLKAHLLIDAQALEEVVKSRKVLPGMRLQPR